jgi:putative Ca2+/H+ antiporter (TMEM165/GDT1 family)
VNKTMFNIRAYPFVRFRRLLASTRPLLILTTIIFSILLIFIYLDSHNHYRRDHLPRLEIVLPNGTKIFINDKESQDHDHWHDRIASTLKDSAHFGFIHAFIASISVIVVSELGDKTFFIAAIMAMRHSRLIIYAGAMSALGTMTILSALLGNIVTKFVPRIYTYYLSSLLFACFGIKMLRDGYLMSPDEGTDEYEEVQHEVEKAEVTDDLELGGNGMITSNQQQQQRSISISKQRSSLNKFTSILRRYVSPILIQAFIMTFLAEWGDRSQITTIVLAASENLFGVIVGGTIGHGLCTGLAVIGGRFVAQRISPKTVTLVGGIVFICFAFSAFFIRPDT